MTTLMDEAIDVGTTKRLSNTFESFDAIPVLFDPANVTLTLKDPDGNKYSLTAIRDSLGRYHVEFVVPMAGQWRYRWESTSTIRTREGSFVVRRSEIAQGNVEMGLPTRFPTVEFYPDDALSARFVFRSTIPPYDPIDVSSSLFTVKAWSTLGDVVLPVVDMTVASTGVIYLRWTAEQVATFPPFFTVSIAEGGGFAAIGEETWDDLPDDETWDGFPDIAWSETGIWDRTVLIGDFVRNAYGNQP